MKYSKKNYVITSAQGIQSPYSANMYGREPRRGKVNKELMKNIEKYKNFNNTEIKICAIPGSYVNEIELDPYFNTRNDVYIGKESMRRNEQNKIKERKKREQWEKNGQQGEKPMHYFWDEIPDVERKIIDERFNENISIKGVPEPPQNKNPLVGKERYTQKHGGNSVIIPSPKKRLKPIASGQAGDFPKLLMTTGSCTHPSYNTSNRTGKMAYEDHKYGFLALNILDNKRFLTRFVPAKKNGNFIDMGISYYTNKEPKKAITRALIIGDSHVSEIDPLTEKANKEMIKWFEPKNIHYHDVFSASSINIHEIEDTVYLSNKFKKQETNLEKELLLTAKYIHDNAVLAKQYGGKIWINYSNHDDMLYRWLTKQMFRKDKENIQTAYNILGLGIDRHNTLEKALNYYGDIPSNVTFLKPGQDRIYWGFQCAAHGHLGKNGSRGTLKNLIEGYGKVIMGHVHSYEVINDSMSVGTSTKIPLHYQLGSPSTSMAANAVIYDGGLVQGLPIIKGEWKPKGLEKIIK